MKTQSIPAALSAALLGCLGAMLSACTDLHADVHARNEAARLRDGATYALARMPSRDASADRDSIDAMLRDELAARGLTDATDAGAQYLLSVAYDTRPATVGVGVGVGDAACGPMPCPKPPATLARFGGPAYRHSLTLRFFGRASGDERYTVSAVIVDRDADSLHAMPLLVKSALAKLPFDAPSDWRVKLREDKSGAPQVVSVRPLESGR